jgi:hypothetical protein
MLNRMKSSWFVACLLLGCASCCVGQEACSKPVENERVAAVAALRKQLRAVKLPEEGGTDVPPVAQGLIPQLKSALAQAARAVLACQDTRVDPREVESQIARLLQANPQQQPPDSVVMNGDPRYPEWLSGEYGSNLLVNVTKPQPKLISVQFEFHIECGYDTVWMLFEQQGLRWQEKLVWQAPPYEEISGAFGDFFQTTILPDAAQQGLRVAVAHGHPWCTSRWSGYDLDVIKAQDGVAPKVLWHVSDGYVRDDVEPRLKATADGFELRLEVGTIESIVMTRMGIYRYQLVDGQLVRAQPIAMNGRDFVDEWIQEPWALAGKWSADTAPLRSVHEQFYGWRTAPYDEKTFVTFSYGPVLACKEDKNHFQVEIDHEPPGRADPDIPEYFQIEQGQNSFRMSSASSLPDANCAGKDLMPPR